jgi:hypothetical protein
MWLHGEGSPVCLNAKPPAVEDRNVAVLIYKPRPLVVFLLSPLLPTTVVPPSLPLNPALPNLSVAFSRPDLSLVASAVPPPPDPPPKSSPSPDPPPTTSPSSVLLPRRRPCPTGLLHHLGGQCRRCPPTTWKTHFGNGRRLPLVTGKAPVTDQVLQMSQERLRADAHYW